MEPSPRPRLHSSRVTIGTGAESRLDGSAGGRLTWLERVADALPMLVSYIGTDGRYRMVNKNYELWFGLRAADIEGISVQELVGSAAWSKLEPYFKAALAGREASFEHDLTYESGPPRWVEASYTPDLDDNGRVRGVISFVRDAGQHRAEKQKSQEREKLLQAVVDNAGAAIYAKDREGRYILSNRVHAALMECDQEAMIGKTDHDLAPFDAADRIAAGESEVLGGGQTLLFEETLQLGPGRKATFLSLKFPLRGSSGQTYGVCGISTDITERKSMEEDLLEAHRRKDEFLAALAHELRNPLAPIRSGLQLIKLAKGRPELLEQARSVAERQVELLVRLVDDLLELSRITRGKIHLARERIELSTVIQTALETAQPQIDAGGHQLTVSLPPGRLQLDADHVRIAQAVSNLLINAAKFTPPGGHIKLAAWPEGGNAGISVIDNGRGIPPEILPQIFDLFVQGPQFERAKGGLGIGLTLVKSLVELHGGRVDAFSAGRDRGSTFTIYLPLADEQRKRKSGRRLHSAAPRRRRILVADDNLDAAQLLAALLEMLGHEVVTAAGGEEALEKAAAFRPDAVFLDIGMPDMNGYQVAQRLRAAGERLPLLVAVTGWGQEQDRRRSKQAGFDYHLVKPVDIRQLDELLSSGSEQS